MKFFISLCLSLVLYSATTYSQKSDEKMIREILRNQTISWNEGNLGDFMKGYWNNDRLLFIGQKGPTYGYKTTLENYRCKTAQYAK